MGNLFEVLVSQSFDLTALLNPTLHVNAGPLGRVSHRQGAPAGGSINSHNPFPGSLSHCHFFTAGPQRRLRTFRSHRRRRYRNSRQEKAAQASFTSNLEFIVAENLKGTSLFVRGVTIFTDLSYEEFAAKFLSAPQNPPAEVPAAQKARGGSRAHLNRQGRCAFCFI